MTTLPTSVRYFHEVVRHRSVTQAAASLRISASAISRQIQKIEAAVGEILFERRARGMALTPAGEIFARFSRDVMQNAERVRSELEELRGLKRGHVRIYSVEGAVENLLSNAISDFDSRFPGISFELTVAGSDEVVASLLEGNADIGIAFSPSSNASIRSVIHIRDPICAVMHPNHHLARKRYLSLREIAALPLAIPAATMGIRIRHLIDLTCRHDAITLRPQLVSNRLHVLRDFAARFAGVTLLPPLAVKHELKRRLLVAVPLRDPLLKNTAIEVCTLSGRRLPLAAERFLQSLNG